MWDGGEREGETNCLLSITSSIVRLSRRSTYFLNISNLKNKFFCISSIWA